jgi:hypothetical protein
MQSSKPSKKTSKQANEVVAPAQDLNAAEVTTKPRTTRSSKTKKSEAAETGTVKHHHKTTPSVVAEPAVTESIKQAIPSVTAQSATSAVKKQVTPIAARQVMHQDIAELAHSYWIARGCAHGSAEADWLRAERELIESR